MAEVIQFLIAPYTEVGRPSWADDLSWEIIKAIVGALASAWALLL